jgi:hypothetical protein
MKKGNNNNTLHPHLLCFWIKGNFKEGVILRTRKKKSEDGKQTENTQTKEKDDDEDIIIKLYKYFMRKLKYLYLWGKN